MKLVASNSFSLNIAVMKMIGLYPTKNFQSLHKVYAFIIYILAMMPSTIFGTLHLIFPQDVTTFRYNDFILVGVMFYSFKFLPLIVIRHRITKCIHYFDDPYFLILQDQKNIIEDCVNICRRNSKMFFVSCIGGALGFLIELILRKDYQALPFNVWLPNFIKENSFWYYTLYFLLACGTFYSALVCGTIDPLIAGLIHHATSHIQVLKENLQYLDKYIDMELLQVELKDKNTRKKLISTEIKKCIHYYQAIYKFVEEFGTCFSLVMFSQFIGSGIIIGFGCFELSKMLTVDISFVIILDCLCALFLQIFFYCYYGALLIEENTTLSTAVYMSQWYEYDIHSQKLLIILMEISQKVMVVKAGKLFEVSLETFLTILRRAYSFLAILNNY